MEGAACACGLVAVGLDVGKAPVDVGGKVCGEVEGQAVMSPFQRGVGLIGRGCRGGGRCVCFGSFGEET